MTVSRQIRSHRTAAMIMAGGEGSRLSVLSEKRAKPAVPFGGIYRIIDFTMSNVMHSQIPVVGICTQYKPYSLMDHLSIGEAWGFARRGYVAKVLPPYTGEEDSDWYAGTADAIYQNLGFIERYQPDLVLVLSGDHIYRMDYRPLFAFHLEHGAALTVVCQEVQVEETSRFGIAETDSEERIKGFQEKPKTSPRSNLANLGIYVFDAAVLADRLRADAHNDRSSHDFARDIIPAMIESGPCYAHRFSGYWRDVGTCRSYWEAHMDMLDPRSGLEINRWKVYTATKSLCDGSLVAACIRRSGRIHQSVISCGCQIEGVVRHSVLSPGVRVGPGSVVENSVLLNGVQIGRECIIRDSIIDKQSIVDDRCVVGDECAQEKDEKGEGPVITLVGKQVHLPADYTVCPGCIIPFATGPETLPPPPLRPQSDGSDTIRSVGAGGRSRRQRAPPPGEREEPEVKKSLD